MLFSTIKEFGPWCIGWIAWLYERRQTTLAHRQLNEITRVFLKMLSHDRAAAAIVESLPKPGDDSAILSVDELGIGEPNGHLPPPR
jgi:hypothetical protein